MPLKECPNHHYFNGDKYGDTCNICGAVLKKDAERAKSQEELEAELRLQPKDYVCGWLVCIEGLNKGRAFPLHPGKNFIGSGDLMDVQLLGDPKIDEYRHATIVFDEKKVESLILPGESVGIAYLEKTVVLAPNRLTPQARITLGDTELMYVPFCNENFNWD